MLARRQPDGAAELVEYILTKSNGVFLWVRLVVRSLLRRLAEADNLTHLRFRLQILPAELEAMYDHMLREIPERYHTGASQIFQIVLATRSILNVLAHNGDEAEPLTLIDLALADSDPEDGINAAIQPLTERELLHRCEALKR
jgi:hypothetical protein